MVESVATKEDLKKLVTKEELKDSVRDVVRRKELERFATKKDLEELSQNPKQGWKRWLSANWAGVFVAFLALLISIYSLRENDKSFQLDHRAWIGPVGGGVVGGLKEGTPATFTILVKNFGKTPALKYTNRVGLQTDSAEIPFKPRYRPELIKHMEPSESVIQPNGEMQLTVGSKGPISKQTIDGIRDETIRYYVFGELLYRDVFKRPHYTRFCAFVLPNLTGINSCNTYNETDEG
jgi:hypothetical protein